MEPGHPKVMKEPLKHHPVGVVALIKKNTSNLGVEKKNKTPNLGGAGLSPIKTNTSSGLSVFISNFGTDV